MSASSPRYRCEFGLCSARDKKRARIVISPIREATISHDQLIGFGLVLIGAVLVVALFVGVAITSLAWMFA